MMLGQCVTDMIIYALLFLCRSYMSHLNVNNTHSSQLPPHFNENIFKREVSIIPFHINNIFSDVGDQYWIQNIYLLRF